MISPRRSGIYVRSLLASCCLFALLALALRPAPAHAQTQRTVPGNDYLLVMSAYFDGDFNTARKGFNSCAQGGIRGVDGRWIDSICYHTMIGECYYNLGDRAQALDQYTSSLQMFLAYRTWLLQVTFPEIISEASAPKVGNINWGRSTRTTLIAGLPDSMLSAQGRLDNSAVVQRGGVVAPPQYMPVRVLEVLRCTALAIARRREIMGPVCEYDPLTNQVLDALARRPAPPNHWSQAFVSVQLGLAYSAAGKRAEAVAELGKGLQVANRYDHPLTPIALLELGKLAFAEGKFDVAATMFYEATFPAVAFGQHDMLEEAFRWGQLTHIVSNQPGVYQPLVAAQTWVRTQGSQVTQASLAILTAECLSNANDPADAAKMLAVASRAMAGQEMQAGQIGARFNYETARVAFATGKFAAGNTALATCMAFQKGGSRRLYQIALADKLYTTGEIRVDRIAELLYDDVLREPKAADWAVDPMETMTIAMIPHLGPMEHWFEVCVKRKQPEKAAEVADLIRRHRFYSTMPTGGRLLALRWILEAPETMLADNVKLQRRDLLAKYPKLAELSQLSTGLQAKISALPRVPADDKAAKEQAELFKQLTDVSALQEVLLSDIALRRDPSEFVFPPVTSVKELQQRLKPGQAVLAYFTTTRYVVGFAIGKESCKMWQISPADTTKFKQEFGSILKAWGMTDKNALVATAELRKPEWKAASTKILTALTNGAKAEHFDNLQELIIVPDGLLWYVPFEAMQLEEDGATVSLISKLRVRYAPTLGLALPDNRALPRPAQSMIVAGRMYTKEDPAVAPDNAAEIAKVLPGSFVAPAQLTAFGNTYVSTIDRLIVLDDIDDAEQGPFAWSPTRRDAGKPGGALSNWPGLPWAGPQQVIVPGYHTPVENGLKKGGAAAGDDVFLSVMGLMASGSRTVLISRWRTGGQSTYDLMREFVQELPHTSAANAWQRAVQLVTATDLDLPRELRIRSTADETLSADHPFFWAGFLLVDTGAEPPAE